MKLSELPLENFGISLLNDKDFETLGTATQTDKKNVLIFIDNKDEIDMITEKSDQTLSIICLPELQSFISNNIIAGLSEDPITSFFTLNNYLSETNPAYQISPETEISPKAKIHETAFIDDNVKISDGCIIHPHATILKGSILEESVVIGPRSVIGSEAGFHFSKNKTIVPITHTGGVLLKKGVEIQTNSCIERGIFPDFTTIGNFTKVDNLVSIASNVKIGNRCSIISCSTIEKDTVIGDDVWVGPNSTISDKLLIGNSAKISLGAVVTENVDDNTVVTMYRKEMKRKVLR